MRLKSKKYIVLVNIKKLNKMQVEKTNIDFKSNDRLQKSFLYSFFLQNVLSNMDNFQH